MAKSLDLIVSLIGRDAGVGRMFDAVGRDAKGLGDHFDHAGGKAGKFGKIGNVAMLGVAGAAGAAAAGVALAVPALVAMGKNAAEDEKAQARLALALKNTAGATRGQVGDVEAWISKVGEATGVADDQMRPAFQRLVQATGDIGEAQRLMGVAMDASAGSGKSLETVTTALAKAQNGNMGALSRLGVQIKDSDGKALSFKDTVKGLSDTFEGQSARAADSLEGKMGRLKLMFDEAKESVGARLLPVFGTLMDFVFDRAIPAFKEWGERIMPKLREVWDGLKSAFEEAKPGLENIGKVLLGIGGFIADKVVPVMITLEGVILKNVVKALGKLGEVLPSIGAGILSFVGGAVQAFGGLWDVVLGGVENLLKGLAKVPGPWQSTFKQAAADVEGFRDRQKVAIDGAVKAIDGAKVSLQQYAAEAAKDRTAKMQADVTDLEAKLQGAKLKLTDPDLTKERKAELKADIADLTEKVRTAKEKIASVEGKTVKIGVDVVVDGKTVGYKQGNGVTQPIGKVYGFADGGIVRRRPGGILANIGEGRYDEAVIPLRPGTSLAASGGDVHVHFHGAIIGSREDMARYVTDAQLEYKRARGVPLGLA